VDQSLIVQGRRLDGPGLEQLRHWVGGHPGWSCRRLSVELASRWDWRNGVGQLKDMAARTLLLKLHQRGAVRKVASDRFWNMVFREPAQDGCSRLATVRYGWHVLGDQLLQGLMRKAWRGKGRWRRRSALCSLLKSVYGPTRTV